MVTNLDLHKLAGYIKDIKFCMLSTVNEDGSIIGRPMAGQSIDEKSFDGRLWFFSKKDTLKIHSIERDSHINLSYSNPAKQSFVSISGRGFVTEERETMQKQWSPALKAWFPEGLNDPEICLIEVNIESAEVWEAPPGKVVQLVGIIKSLVTGRSYDQYTHGQHLDVNRTH